MPSTSPSFLVSSDCFFFHVFAFCFQPPPFSPPPGIPVERNQPGDFGVLLYPNPISNGLAFSRFFLTAAQPKGKSAPGSTELPLHKMIAIFPHFFGLAYFLLRFFFQCTSGIETPVRIASFPRFLFLGNFFPEAHIIPT